MNPIKSINVLIVDDEPLLRSSIEYEVSSMGWKVSEASSGNEAKKLVDSQKFDLVISDIRMPNGDGFDLLKHIRAKHGTSLPVILMTGFADIPLCNAYDEGAEAYVGKPFDIEVLEEHARTIFNSIHDRWASRNQDSSSRIFNIDVSTAPNRKLVRLGRGGIFVSAEMPVLNRGDQVHFDLVTIDGIKIEGDGIVRWVRTVANEGLPSGCGIEFVFLSDGCRNEVIKKIVEKNPISLIHCK